MDNDGQAVEPLTLDEVKAAIRGLKNNKAAGKDELLAELFKHGSVQLYQLLHCIIALLNSAYKILSEILLHRWRPIEEYFVETPRKDQRRIRCSPCDRFSINFWSKYNLKIRHLFIDFKVAYDSVTRNELCKIMIEHGFPAKLIRLIGVTLDGSKSSCG